MGGIVKAIFGGGDKPKAVKPPTDTEATKSQAARVAANRGAGLSGTTNLSVMRQAYESGLHRTLGGG